MSTRKKNTVFSKLRERLFGSPAETPKKTVSKTKTKIPEEKKPQAPVRPKREPYYIQIGFDFGTSFSKCIIRDVNFDRAQVYIPEETANSELPFLMPTTLRLHGTKLSRAPLNGNFYGRGYLPFIKMALTSTAQGTLKAACLNPFIKVCNTKGWTLSEFVVAAAAFYLAKSFGEIDDFIRSKFEGFGEMDEDRQFVNVAIPIFHESNHNIEYSFNKAIKIAWVLRDQFRDVKSIEVDELMKVVSANQDAKDMRVEDGAPYLYPEISAGLQVYAKSNSFPHGIYLFSDTGAGTVDQAVFTYHDNGFSFLEALVSPLGSSEIEAFAKEHSEKELEELRLLKESGIQDKAIELAKNHLVRHVERKTMTLVADTTQYKLYLKDQIQKAALLFSGGGHCYFPYEAGVRYVFESGPLFKKKVRLRTYGMPDLHDLEFGWNVDKDTWINRLHVAYGLSYPDYDLEKVKLPDEVSDTRPR